MRKRWLRGVVEKRHQQREQVESKRNSSCLVADKVTKEMDSPDVNCNEGSEPADKEGGGGDMERLMKTPDQHLAACHYSV